MRPIDIERLKEIYYVYNSDRNGYDLSFKTISDSKFSFDISNFSLIDIEDCVEKVQNYFRMNGIYENVSAYDFQKDETNAYMFNQNRLDKIVKKKRTAVVSEKNHNRELIELNENLYKLDGRPIYYEYSNNEYQELLVVKRTGEVQINENSLLHEDSPVLTKVDKKIKSLLVKSDNKDLISYLVVEDKEDNISYIDPLKDNVVDYSLDSKKVNNKGKDSSSLK